MDPAIETCPDCDRLQRVPRGNAGGAPCCVRCGARLPFAEPNLARDAALAVTVLVLLAIANGFPLLALDIGGRQEQATVFDGVVRLWDARRYELALVVAMVAVVIPVMHATAVLVRSYLIAHGYRRQAARTWALWSVRLAPWGMTEVYLLGALVAFVKLGDIAAVVVGPALWAFALMSVLTAWTSSHAAGMWTALARG